jgi:hypothetical protein
MGKTVFEESFEEMLELDKNLDVNEMLNSLPAINTELKEEPEVEEDEAKKEVKQEPLKDINKVLDKEVKKVVKKDEAEEVIEKQDDKAPAPNELTAVEKSSDSPFTVIFAKDLVQQGLISSFDETKFLEKVKDVGEATALRDLIKGEIEENINAAKEDLDEGYQQYLSLIGKGVPAESASSLLDLKNQFESIKVDELAKEENVELRKKVITDYYKLTTSMTDAKIEKLVQSSIDMGDDVEDSKEYLATLKTAIKEQIQAEEAEANHQATIRAEENNRIRESLKETCNTLEPVIPGVEINKQTRVKMYENLTKEVKDSKGRITNPLWAKRAEDPIYFDARLAYLLETGFFEKGKPWEKAGKAKTTKEVSELEKILESKRNTGSTSGHPAVFNVEQEKTTRDNIESMRGIFGK